MSTYSVTDAKASLSRLINRALAGEEVIVTRRGKPVVELHPTAAPIAPDRNAALARLLAHRFRPAAGAPTSVELLNMVYDEPNDARPGKAVTADADVARSVESGAG
jgi:prevent-host-death family protein